MKRLAILAIALVAASGLSVVGSHAALAATVVHCPPTGTDDLQTAINNAPPGSQLVIYGTCTGNFDLNRNLTLVGQNAVLDGNNSGTVLSVDAGVTAVVDYLTIQHGNGFHGGGIQNAGTLTLNGATVSRNMAVEGGVIYNHGTMTLNGTTVSGNTASDEGGGIYSDGTMTIKSSTLSGNSAFDATIENDGTLTVTGSTISNNTSETDGGAITNDVSLTVTGANLTGNTAESGGAIRNYDVMTVKSSSITANAALDGGGIYNDGATTLSSSTVSNNTASDTGGGIFVETGTVTLRGSSVSPNSPNNCAPPGSVPGCTG